MQGKSRVMAAVAAGALVVALGAGAARCAIAPQEGAQDSPQEQEQPAAAGADVATGKAASGAEALWNTAWTGADDPTATLRIVEGAMAESAGGTERAWFFSAEEPSEAGGVLSVPIEVKGTGDKAGGLSLIQVSGDGDNRTLACDLLTQAYVPQKAQDGAFSVTGTDGRLSEALGADVAAIEEASPGRRRRCPRRRWEPPGTRRCGSTTPGTSRRRPSRSTTPPRRWSPWFRAAARWRRCSRAGA